MHLLLQASAAAPPGIPPASGKKGLKAPLPAKRRASRAAPGMLPRRREGSISGFPDICQPFLQKKLPAFLPYRSVPPLCPGPGLHRGPPAGACCPSRKKRPDFLQNIFVSLLILCFFHVMLFPESAAGLSEMSEQTFLEEKIFYIELIILANVSIWKCSTYLQMVLVPSCSLKI